MNLAVALENKKSRYSVTFEDNENLTLAVALRATVTSPKRRVHSYMECASWEATGVTRLASEPAQEVSAKELRVLARTVDLLLVLSADGEWRVHSGKGLVGVAKWWGADKPVTPAVADALNKQSYDPQYIARAGEVLPDCRAVEAIILASDNNTAVTEWLSA